MTSGRHKGPVESQLLGRQGVVQQAESDPSRGLLIAGSAESLGYSGKVVVVGGTKVNPPEL